MKKILIKEAAKKEHQRTQKNRRDGVKLRSFDRRTPLYGAVQIDSNYQGRERMVGFVVAGSFEEELKSTCNYLHSRRLIRDRIKELCKSVKSSGGPASNDPLAFIFTISRFPIDDKLSWSVPFITYQEDLRWAYDLLTRRILLEEKIPQSLFFA